MIADLTTHRLDQTSATEEAEILDDAVVIWAALNATQDVEGEDVEAVNAVQAWFSGQISQRGISQADLFEHARAAVEAGDLQRFGVWRPPERAPEKPGTDSSRIKKRWRES